MCCLGCLQPDPNHIPGSAGCGDLGVLDLFGGLFWGRTNVGCDVVGVGISVVLKCP